MKEKLPDSKTIKACGGSANFREPNHDELLEIQSMKAEINAAEEMCLKLNKERAHREERDAALDNYNKLVMKLGQYLKSKNIDTKYIY